MVIQRSISKMGFELSLKDRLRETTLVSPGRNVRIKYADKNGVAEGYREQLPAAGCVLRDIVEGSLKRMLGQVLRDLIVCKEIWKCGARKLA